MVRKAVNPAELLEGIKKGSRLALGRMISFVENRPEEAYEVLEEMYHMSGNATVIGITGVQGAGKSTLVEKVTLAFRKKGLKVGIIGVDPSSPFTGGAFLGDRIRMISFDSDDDVFMRSIATRGAVGGLSNACSDVVKVMDAFGMDIIIIETVGAGQDETEIIKMSDIRVLVLMPGLGDQIQLSKAGTMEIADIFVMNKSDYPEAEKTVLWIEMLAHSYWASSKWKPPVISAVATEGKGIESVIEKIQEFITFQAEGDADSLLQQRRRARVVEEVELVARRSLREKRKEIVQRELSPEVIDDILNKKRSPYSLGRKICNILFAWEKDL